jgi:BON domain
MSRCNRLLAIACAVTWLGAVGGCALPGRCGDRECPDETATRTEVETLYSHYPELRPPNQLYVQVRGSRVTIVGQVNSEYERRLAESVARQAKGVTVVVNLLGIAYAGR